MTLRFCSVLRSGATGLAAGLFILMSIGVAAAGQERTAHVSCANMRVDAAAYRACLFSLSDLLELKIRHALDKRLAEAAEMDARDTGIGYGTRVRLLDQSQASWEDGLETECAVPATNMDDDGHMERVLDCRIALMRERLRVLWAKNDSAPKP